MNADLRERVAKAMWESRKYRGTWEAGTTETERADYLHMAAAALSVAQGQGWREIESAPRDGAFLAILDCGGDRVICTMRWPVAEEKNSRPEGVFLRDRVTHWWPLPELPAAPAQPDGVRK